MYCGLRRCVGSQRSGFGPGLEDRFLGFKGGRDQVIYSLLRVRDAGLARELWIRLEEGEITFAEAASTFSEGPEAHRKGVMGPMEIGTLQPQTLQDLLRACVLAKYVHPRSWESGMFCFGLSSSHQLDSTISSACVCRMKP